MSHVYRCNRCRTRNTFLKAVQAYVRKAPTCRHCNHTRFYVDKERIERRPCYCGGYHYAHRPGSPCCELNVNSLYYRALRGDFGDCDPPPFIPKESRIEAP